MQVGRSDTSDEDEAITIALTRVSSEVYQRSQDMEPEPADWTVCHPSIKVGQRAAQRIEGPVVIAELDLQPAGLQAKGDLHLAPRGLAVQAMVDGVSKQLFQDDQEPTLLCARQSMIMGELLGEANQLTKFRRIAAQIKR